MIIYEKIPKVKCISFDLDDTLYDNKGNVERAEDFVFNYIFEHYISQTTVDYLKKYYQIIKNDFCNNFPWLLSDVSLCRYFILKHMLEYFSNYNHNLSSIISQELVNLFIKERSVINVSRETLVTLEKLSKKYLLVAITNGNLDIKKTILYEYFSGVFFANINQLCKPHKDMFYIVCKLYNIKPYELCHIGDDPITDVYGAKSFGASVIFQQQYINKSQSLKIIPNICIDKISELTEIFR
ncbi:MAG: HAD-IA family hydrolase [Succinivibrionaceae bacterium]